MKYLNPRERLNLIVQSAETGVVVELDGCSLLPDTAKQILMLFSKLTPENRNRLLQFRLPHMTEVIDSTVANLRSKK